MRFVILRKADHETEAGALPTEELITAMMKYNDELMKAGVLAGGDGLQPSAKGARVKFSGGKPNVVDGPFAEAKELVAGFTLIDVQSREEALEWAKRWPAIDGHGEVELEVRQVYEAVDFGEAYTPQLQEAFDQIARAAGRA
ncbi:MAG TPA: YciI family protein [Thermoanaerobaculia bacterium]|nr:YciI family protein [Thermoanaerobaculia bacterium]